MINPVVQINEAMSKTAVLSRAWILFSPLPPLFIVKARIRELAREVSA